MYRRIIEPTEAFASRTSVHRRIQPPPRVPTPDPHMEEYDPSSRISPDGYFNSLSIQLEVNDDPSSNTSSLSLNGDRLAIKIPSPHVDVQSSAVDRFERRRHILSDASSSSSSDCSPPKQSRKTQNMGEDLIRLFNNPDSFPDATLKCGVTEIPVHKCILSARSPVFEALFRIQMKEANNSIVDIVDIEPDVMEAMLKYVYSGKTDHVTADLAEDLLFAADKYQINGLKLDCIKKLKKGMTQSSVLRILVLGELHDESLKAHAIVYIAKHLKFSEVESTEEWKILQKERSKLAMEVLIAVAKNISKKSFAGVKIDAVTSDDP